MLKLVEEAKNTSKNYSSLSNISSDSTNVQSIPRPEKNYENNIKMGFIGKKRESDPLKEYLNNERNQITLLLNNSVNINNNQKNEIDEIENDINKY